MVTIRENRETVERYKKACETAKNNLVAAIERNNKKLGGFARHDYL